jgi:hypothetical protein
MAKQEGYVAPEDIMANQKAYIAAQKKNPNVKMVGNTIVQYGGGSMFKPGSYDRYTPFKNNPDAHYIVIAWPMGLIQIAKNPFNPGKNPHHLGDIAQKVMNKHRSKMQNTPITVDNIKRIFEMDIKKGDRKAMGFKVSDLFALFKSKIKTNKKVPREDWKRLAKVMNMPFRAMRREDKDFLGQFYVSFWDIVEAGSGGHKDITNISGLNFMGKGYVDFLKQLQNDFAKEMSDKKLEEGEEIGFDYYLK